MDDQTLCVTNAKVDFAGYESLAVPVCRASTIKFDSAADYSSRSERGADGYVYGLYGTPTHRFLEKKLTELERGERTVLVPSGQAAITVAMLTVLKSGDSVLIPDAVYPPVRDFANRDLERYGIRAIWYDPCDLTSMSGLIEPNTRLIWVESPGSTTMEIQDLAGIASIAHSRGALVGCDNTWATPLLFKPLVYGADIVVEALSKYISGHSDILMGSITVHDPELGLALKSTLGRFGVGVSPDDVSLVLRGIETLSVRLERASKTAEKLALWIAVQKITVRVLHPTMNDFPNRDIWLRDFKGASGVFSVILKDEAIPYLGEALNKLKTFSIGASWGGTKSLIVPMSVNGFRSAKPWPGPEIILRISAGMESETALLEDLELLFGVLAERMEVRLPTDNKDYSKKSKRE